MNEMVDFIISKSVKKETLEDLFMKKKTKNKKQKASSKNLVPIERYYIRTSN